MKYIQNNGRYALAFEITKNGRAVKIEFDRKRIYKDTGNIATTGITAVEDVDYSELKKIKRFNKLLETKEFEETDASKVATAESKVADLEKENAELKAKLEKGTTDKDTKKELKAKDKEIADLKAQLEALSKDKTDSESEGF